MSYPEIQWKCRFGFRRPGWALRSAFLPGSQGVTLPPRFHGPHLPGKDLVHTCLSAGRTSLNLPSWCFIVFIFFLPNHEPVLLISLYCLLLTMTMVRDRQRVSLGSKAIAEFCPRPPSASCSLGTLWSSPHRKLGRRRGEWCWFLQGVISKTLKMSSSFGHKYLGFLLSHQL